MNETTLDIQAIYDLIDKVSSSGLGELELSKGDFKLVIRAKKPLPPAPPVILPASGTSAPIQAASQTDAPASAVPEAAPEGNVMKSPIVGTFYLSPAPGKPPFVTVGQSVKKGDVLFIIESMKLMNEIQSEFDGVIDRILVENGTGVEFGQPIMVIK